MVQQIHTIGTYDIDIAFIIADSIHEKSQQSSSSVGKLSSLCFWISKLNILDLKVLRQSILRSSSGKFNQSCLALSILKWFTI